MENKRLKNLIAMLREIDLYKNSPEQVGAVLNFIAFELEDMEEGKNRFQIVIETIDEEFELIAEYKDEKEAINFAQNYPRERYKAITIYEVDKNGNDIREVEF